MNITSLPSATKLLFLRYLQTSNPVLASSLVGLETADHPTDRQIAAHVREYFETASDGVSRRAGP